MPADGTSIRIASAGSGSRGNATLVEADGIRVLVDCGFGARELSERLAALDVDVASIDAVLLTHEHADHASGAAAAISTLSLRVMATPGTAHALGIDGIETFSAHHPLHIGPLEVRPVPVPHDAREPVQFVFEHRGVEVGVLTDLGHVSRHVQTAFADLDALLLESNHDLDALWRGPYPTRLKRRVAGPHGHLSNEQAGQLLAGVRQERLQHVIVAHVSEQNNSPELARETLAEISGVDCERLTVATQDGGFAWREVVR